ncbi:MAG: hypothetical protein ACK4K7_00620 [Allosphingosinicella sp.]|uniref:hypothetical protein n=1 Tax=Allosphingosinicella sp. TaxID=2823234 RepID=UPI003964103A
MPHPLTLPALGLAAIAGAVAGIYLGEDSVAQINPIHFQGPAIHPKDRGAAVPEWEPEPPRAAFAGLYGWTQGQAARAQDCGGCDLGARDRHAETGWAPEPLSDTRPRRAAVSVAFADEVVTPSAAAEPRLDFDVDRYAYYPVNAEQAELYASYE